jgi:hypothetical protein
MKDLGQDGKLGRNKLSQTHQPEHTFCAVRGPVCEGSGEGWQAGRPINRSTFSLLSDIV